MRTHLSRGVERTIIGCIGDESLLAEVPLRSMPGVEDVVPVLKPYKLASREFAAAPSIVRVGDDPSRPGRVAAFGGQAIAVIAGPCSVEGPEMLCERGIRTFEVATRNTLDVAAVPVLKRETHLPVIVDPSHACGLAELVAPLSFAAIAAGADGLIVEVHPDPANALSDGDQSLSFAAFRVLMQRLVPF